VETRSLVRAAADDDKHVNMDADNWTYNCYRLCYRYNVVLVLNNPLDSDHMHCAVSYHDLCVNDR